MKKILTHLSIVLVLMALLVSSVSLALICPVSAEEIPQETTQETIPEEELNAIDKTYQDSKNKVSEVIEEYGIKEILLKYFDENLTELIITCIVAFGGAIIFVSYIIIATRKLLTCIKKYGVESDSTKEVIKILKKQLEETKGAYDESKECVEQLKANEESLKTQLAKILETLKVAFTNDESLVKRGYADEINKIIEKEEITKL